MEFKTIGLLGRGGNDAIATMLADLAHWLTAQGLQVSSHAQQLSVHADQQRIGREFERIQPDLVIVVGGDGTILNAAHLLAAHGTPLLGVNMGRLGFLADITMDRFRDGVTQVLNGQFTEEQRALLSGAITHNADRQPSHVALNDVVVQKSASGRLIEFETWVDASFVCTHRADGVIVATPTGSTAYALSGGGPIVHPALNACVLVPINPHTLSDRPIVVSSNSTVEIVLRRGYGDPVAQVSWDSQYGAPLAIGDRVTVKRAAKAIRLLHPHDYDYYKTLRTKLDWGNGRQP